MSTLLRHILYRALSCHFCAKAIRKQLSTCELDKTMYKAILPLLNSDPNTRSTTLGSIAMADAFRALPTPAYKITKAALNMLTVQYAQQYADDGFTFLGISPGVSEVLFVIY